MGNETKQAEAQLIADKDYIIRGVFYLKGAQMPKGWKPPEEKRVLNPVKVIGPDGETMLTPMDAKGNLTPGKEAEPEAEITL
jgi:hypothetical protein